MSYAALGFLRRQYLCVLRRCAWFNAVMLAGLVAVPGGAACAGGITPDGRTQTQLAVHGSITDITTQTIRGVNAYNSFSQFNVAAGSTVNLHLPGQTSNLLNLVSGGASYLNGLVNAYKGGQIGGNVYFFNPNGVVVGAGGVMNVGSLTLATPSAAFMDRLLSPTGAIDDAATQQALSGQVPLSASGLISVRGRINASRAVLLAGGNVDIASGAQVLAGTRAQVAFADLVNLDGIAQGSEVVNDGGTIRIVAAADIGVAGTLAADGAGAHSSGGAVAVLAGGNASLAASGRVSADAGSSGDGGFVEFSARHAVSLVGNGLSARATDGAAGHLLIDPTDLVWSGAGDDFYSHGSTITISADNSVTLDNVVVSSRNIGAAADTRSNHASAASAGDSGDIDVSAKTIELKNGTQLLANADHGHAAGKISLSASDDASTPFFGSADDSVASITINNAVLRGGDISIAANANDKWVWVDGQDNSSVSGVLANIGISALDFISSLRLGANLTYSRAQAAVDIDGGALIDASGKLDVNATAKADASMHVASTVVGFGYGETNSKATVNVGSATLGSDGDMTLKSQADSTLTVKVDTVNSGAFSNAASDASKYANFSFAVGLGNQVATTTVGDDAVIARADKLAVEATGDKQHSIAASGGSFKDGIASAGISVAITDTEFNASLGGDVHANQVAVKATLAGASTEVSASAGTAGSPDVREAITSAKPVDEIVFEKLSDLMAAAPSTDQRSGASSKLGLSAAFAWIDNTDNVTAEVAANAHITTPGALDVLANAAEDVSFATSAAVDQREIGTQLPGDPNAPSDKKKIAISASVAVTDMKLHSSALIGDGAVVQAGGAVNVNAASNLSPFWSQWTTLIDQFKTMDWSGADNWYTLAGDLKDVIADPVHATSWTQTAVESDKLALAGALDFFSLDNQATAKIGAASINANAASPTTAQDVNVIARASQGVLNLVGVPEFDPTSSLNNSSSGSAGFGGSYLQFNLSGGSDASIAQGASLRADDVAVLADTAFDQVNVAETVGKAGKVSINGAFSLVDTDLHTIAQIGSGGSVVGNDVLVKAQDESLLVNVAGGVARSQAVGIGFSVALNQGDRETRALIGNRATESGSGGTLDASGNLLLDADASGTLGAFTVAGSGPSSNEEDAGKTGGDGSKTNAADSGQQGKSGVGISAAASVNLIHDTTAASVSNLSSVKASGTAASSIDLDTDADGSNDLTVALAQGLTASASDSTLALAGAGGLTVALDKSAGLAGAFTWNELVKDTRATIADAAVTVAHGGVNLDAENSGAMWSISASAAGGDKVGIAGSVSYSTIDNVTEAAIENAAVGADGATTLTANDDSDIRSVAGAASFGGKAGIGAGVAISTVDSDTLAHIDGGSVAADGGVAVHASNANSIFSVAAALGASQGVAVSGSVTINQIGNQTHAYTSDALVTSSANAVKLAATDNADILSIAGSVALSAGQASVGIAAAYNNIGNDTSARADGGSLSGSSIDLGASETAGISTYAVGGAGSARVAVTGSLGINTITNTTTAASDGATLASAGDAAIHASDVSTITSITGAAAVGGYGAVGAAGSYNHIGGEVRAEVSGGSVDAANVLVDAERAGTLDVWAISGSGAGVAGFAGSIALNDAGGATTARIGEAATVAADGNALVTAQADDSIQSKAGAVGLGGSLGAAGGIAFNDIHAATLAEVGGANTAVTALGNGAAALVDNGALGSGSTLKAKQLKDSVHGVAVVASSTAQVENYALSAAGGGSAAVAATVSVAMLGGSTTAQVTDAAVLNNRFGSAQQEARVGAYHHDSITSGTGGGAVGGEAGVGGAADTAVVSHTTSATIDGASASARKAVTVDAASTTSVSQAVIAVGGGGYAGLAGTVGVILLDGTTQATAHDATLDSHGDLKVEATSDAQVDLTAGALAVSGIAGVGLTAAVSVVQQHTLAAVSGSSHLSAWNSTGVNAASTFGQTDYAYTAAAAGGVGIAGTVNVVVVKGSTDADVGGAVVVNADDGQTHATQDVALGASDRTTVTSKVGSLGVGGGVGVGAVADVVLIHNGASANVAGGAQINAGRDISVNAASTRDVDSLSTAAAGGYSAGIAGAVSVISIGARPTGDAHDNTTGSVGKVSQLASASATGDQTNAESSASTARADAARAQLDLSADLDAAPTNTSAAANVAAGATLEAGRHVGVSAHNQTNTDAIAVGAAVSGGVSLGGGIAIALVDDRTVAALDATTTAGGDVSVSATDDQPDASVLRTYAGGAGVAGLAASYALHQKSSTANAELGGVVNATGAVTVDAGIDHDLDAEGGAGALGVVGVGAALAYVTEDGAADASIGDGAQVKAASLDVHGHSRTDTVANVVAAAGGLISGAGADANTDDSSSASASVGDNAAIDTRGGLTQVRAEADPNARAEALGVAVSASVSIGVSLAHATVATQAHAFTGSNVDVAADALTLKAQTLRHGLSAESDATAGAGGLLLGASASESGAAVHSSTIAEVGADNAIDLGGAFAVNADSTTDADATVTGVNVGLLAGGSSASKASTDTTTSALVGDDPTLSAASVAVDANGDDTLRAKTISGAGGLGVLVASKAETQATSHTTAQLGGATGLAGSVDAAQVAVDAAQHVDFNSSADSTNASVVGYSGARASNLVTTDTRALIGQNLAVNAEDFSADAWNAIVKPALASGYNVNSGSGGLLNAAAARSESTIENGALVDVGDGVAINAEQAGLLPVGSLALAAWNTVDASDQVRLDSGGAIAIAKSESVINNDRNDAVVHVGDASLLTDGAASLSARTASHLSAAANSKTYGLAGAAQGASTAAIGANNRIELAAGSKIESDGDLSLLAGSDGTSGNDLYADAETRLWNYTAVPIQTDPDAAASIVQHNTIDIAANAQARSVKSVYLTATEGTHVAHGYGEGTDAYRETLAAIGSFFGADTSSLKITGGSSYDNAANWLDPSSGVNVDGSVQAGIHHLQYLTLDTDGSTVLKQSEGVSFTLEDNVNLADRLQAEIDALRAEAQATRAAANDYQNDSAVADAALGLESDANVLEAQLAALDRNVLVDFIHVDPVVAETGNVRVTGHYLTGNNGLLDAPGDARIDILNRSTRFMTTDVLNIPDDQGGQVTFNGLGVSSTAAINAHNQGGRVATNMTVNNADTSPKPVISVINSNDNDSPTGQPAELWMLGDVTNLRGEAMANSQGTLRVSANIDAETVDIATGGDLIQTYQPGFTHQGGNPISRLGNLPSQNEQNTVQYESPNPLIPASYTDSGASAAGDSSSNSADPGCAVVTCGSSIAGNNVYISGEKLNINGLIQAGLPNRALTIDASLLAAVNPDAAAHSLTTSNSAAIAALRAAWTSGDHSQQFLDLNQPLAGSSAIKVSYDAANDRLQLANVRMGGGHMELFGNIFSTGNGQLNVMDGYGRINVVNSTGYDLALDRLDTGAGVEGVIKITDTARRLINGVLDTSGTATGGTPLITQITRLGDTVSTYDNETADGSVTHLVSTGSGRTSSYAPVANRRFNWLEGQYTVHTVTDVYVTNGVDVFDNLPCDSCSADDNPDPVHTAAPTTPVDRLTGDWLSTGESAAQPDYVFDYTRYTTPVARIYDYTAPKDVYADYTLYDKWRIVHTTKDQWTVYDYYHQSLDASKPIGVGFIGYDSASLNVDSVNSQLLLGGLVRAVNGTATLNGASGIQSLSDDAHIVAANLALTSATGAIGSAAHPLNLDLTDAAVSPGLADGTVSANGYDGVSLKEIGGDLRLAQAQSAHGDVDLVADRNLVELPGVVVSGNNLDLVALSGHIGDAATPFAVETQGDSSTFSASAAGNIDVAEQTGDLRVVQARSGAGDVTLAAPGSLLDDNALETVDQKTTGELLALWDQMALRGNAADDALARSLDAQKGALKQAYEQYFRMRNLHLNDNGSYAADAYNPNYAFHLSANQASVLKAANNWSDADIASYEASQTQAYQAAYARFGAGGYVVDYAPTLSQDETAALGSGHKWSDDQLANAIGAGLLKETSDTNIRIEDPNVVGHAVTLNAGGGIGADLATVTIARGTAFDSLSPAQKLALLTAERNDLTITPDAITIAQHEDFNLDASGPLNAAASGNIYLGSEQNLLLDQVQSPQDVRIKTGAALAAVAGHSNVLGQNIVLEAATGDLGSAATPVTVDVGSGKLTARAGGDLFVDQASGDMRIESVFARGVATLNAPGSILEAQEDDALDVRAASIDLVAGDTIGQPGGERALDVAINPGGRIDAFAPNGVYLSSSGGSGELGDIATHGDFDLTVRDGGIRIVGNVVADAGVQLGADDDIAFDGGSVQSNGQVGLQGGLDGVGSVLGSALPGLDVIALGDVTIQAPDAIGGAAGLELASDGVLNLQGRLIDLTWHRVTPGTPALLNVGALNGAAAQTANIEVAGASAVRFDSYLAGLGAIRTDSALLDVVAGYVGDHVRFTTPYFDARIDHLDRHPTPGLDFRAFTLDGDFSLALTPTVARIGAFVVNQNPHRVVFGTPPGYADQESGASLDGLARSFGLWPFGFERLPDATPVDTHPVALATSLLDVERLLDDTPPAP